MIRIGGYKPQPGATYPAVVKECVEPKLKGYGGLVVYADDFVVCFQNKEEAEEFYKHLKSRMEHFGMTLEESKTSRKNFTKTYKEVHRLIRKEIE